MENEIWKPLVGYESAYEISNFGKIKSNHVINGKISNKIKKTYIASNGYESVTLSLNNVKKMNQIHRLLALTFIPNPDNFPCVNHIDGNKLNNNLSNLEWCSYSENSKHSYSIGLRKYRRISANTVLVKNIKTNEILPISYVVRDLGIKTRNFKDLLERNQVAYDYILFKKGVTEQEKLQFGEILFNQKFSLNNKNEIMKVVHSYIVNNISFKDINSVEIKDNKLQFNLNNNSTKTMEFTKSEIEKQKLEFAIEQLKKASMLIVSQHERKANFRIIIELEQKLSKL